MPSVTVTKIFSFEAMHYLPEHEGKCRNPHGHSYKLEVTVKGSKASNQGLHDEGPQRGMIVDFDWLKTVVHEQLISKWDHAFLCETAKESKFVKVFSGPTGQPLRTYSTGEPTTVENLAMAAYSLLRNYIAELDCELVKIRLWETATCYAEVTS